MKTQKQRCAARARQDKADSMAAAARAGNRCENCHCLAPYVTGLTYGPSNHHDYRKNNYPNLRHDQRNHHWLCCACHRLAHDEVYSGHGNMWAIRCKRGDESLGLHPSVKIDGEIEWYGVNDGYGIVGWSFQCPCCQEHNSFPGTDEVIIICEHCYSVLKNPGDPD